MANSCAYFAAEGCITIPSGTRRRHRAPVWMTRDEIAAAQPRLRSPMVLRGVDDFLAGQRLPLETLARLP